VIQELSQVLWYAAEVCSVLSVNFADVAKINILELAQRKKDGTLKGDGAR